MKLSALKKKHQLISKELAACVASYFFIQGFEVTVNGRTYFGFSDYEEVPSKGKNKFLNFTTQVQVGVGRERI